MIHAYSMLSRADDQRDWKFARRAGPTRADVAWDCNLTDQVGLGPLILMRRAKREARSLFFLVFQGKKSLFITGHARRVGRLFIFSVSVGVGVYNSTS